MWKKVQKNTKANAYKLQEQKKTKNLAFSAVMVLKDKILPKVTVEEDLGIQLKRRILINNKKTSGKRMKSSNNNNNNNNNVNNNNRESKNSEEKEFFP